MYQEYKDVQNTHSDGNKVWEKSSCKYTYRLSEPSISITEVRLVSTDNIFYTQGIHSSGKGPYAG